MQSRGASRYCLIRIRVSFGLWFWLRVVGCHQEAIGKRERERKEDTRRERDRRWNIANHQISILMLRGGAVVNVEGATLGSFEFYIDPTDHFVAVQRPHFETDNKVR